MKNNHAQIAVKDGSAFTDLTDWERLRDMTGKEITAEALSDPDAQPLTEEELRRMRRVSDIPGDTLIEKLHFFVNENKQPLTAGYAPSDAQYITIKE
jgi:hypothetical protein